MQTLAGTFLASEVEKQPAGGNFIDGLLPGLYDGPDMARLGEEPNLLENK